MNTKYFSKLITISLIFTSAHAFAGGVCEDVTQMFSKLSPTKYIPVTSSTGAKVAQIQGLTTVGVKHFPMVAVFVNGEYVQYSAAAEKLSLAFSEVEGNCKVSLKVGNTASLAYGLNNKSITFDSNGKVVKSSSFLNQTVALGDVVEVPANAVSSYSQASGTSAAVYKVSLYPYGLSQELINKAEAVKKSNFRM